jgi:hypothetical protein
MDHVRRRLSSSRNNVSNMRLDGAMGTPLQVQVSTCNNARTVLFERYFLKWDKFLDFQTKTNHPIPILRS